MMCTVQSSLTQIAEFSPDQSFKNPVNSLLKHQVASQHGNKIKPQ